MNAEQIAARVCREVAELPDRNSPDDWPEAMLVTRAELLEIVQTALADLQAPAVAHGAAEPDHDARQCDRCNGDGWHWTEEEGCEPRDKVNVKTHCEQCDGLGWLGPDATAAANHAKEKTNA